MDQRYVIDESVQHGYVAVRDAQTFLPFLQPHLRPGLDVLDVGCGVGSLALDLAPTILPGRVAGIDRDAAQIEAARDAAAERTIENADFETSSVYELPFEDASFDVVYANAVLLYVREPVRALVEMRRVLRPGGLAAVCDDDMATAVNVARRSRAAACARPLRARRRTRGRRYPVRQAPSRGSCCRPGSIARKGSRTRPRCTAMQRARAGSPTSPSACSQRRACAR